MEKKSKFSNSFESHHFVLLVLFAFAVNGLFYGSNFANVTGAQVALLPDFDVLGPITTPTTVSTIARVDVRTGSIAFRFTSLWNMTDNDHHGFFQSGNERWDNPNPNAANRITIFKYHDNNLYFRRMGASDNHFNDLLLAPSNPIPGTGKTVQDFFTPGQTVDVVWVWYQDPTINNLPRMNVTLNGYLAKTQIYTGLQPTQVEPEQRFGIGHNGPQWNGQLDGILTNMKLSRETMIPLRNITSSSPFTTFSTNWYYHDFIQSAPLKLNALDFTPRLISNEPLQFVQGPDGLYERIYKIRKDQPVWISVTCNLNYPGCPKKYWTAKEMSGNYKEKIELDGRQKSTSNKLYFNQKGLFFLKISYSELDQYRVPTGVSRHKFIIVIVK